jgi:hypothetical protein
LPKEAEVADDIRADTIIDDCSERAFDAKVVRITNENLMGSGGLDATENVLGASANDVDQVQETEV